MKVLAKEIRRLRALAKLYTMYNDVILVNYYNHELKILRRILALLMKEVIYGR